MLAGMSLMVALFQFQSLSAAMARTAVKELDAVLKEFDLILTDELRTKKYVSIWFEDTTDEDTHETDHLVLLSRVVQHDAVWVEIDFACSGLDDRGVWVREGTHCV